MKLGLSFRLQCFAYFQSHRAEKKNEIQLVWVVVCFFLLGKLDGGSKSNLNSVFAKLYLCEEKHAALGLSCWKAARNPHLPFILYFPSAFAQGSQSALKILIRPHNKHVEEGDSNFRGGGSAAPFLQPAVNRCRPSSRSSRDAPRMMLFQLHPVTQPLKRELHSALCFPSQWHA